MSDHPEMTKRLDHDDLVECLHFAKAEIERLRERCEALIQAGQDKGKTDGQVFLERVADKKRIAELEAALHLARPMVGQLANDAAPEVMQVLNKIDAVLNKEPDNE